MPASWDAASARAASSLPGLEARLAHPLTPEDALVIAFSANPGFQATLEELGIAHGAVRQAALLENPVFTARHGPPDPRVRPSETRELLDAHEITLTHNVLDFVLRPLRKRVAEEEFEEARLEVGDAAIRLAAEVRTAYWTLVGARETLDRQRVVMESAQTAAELSGRQRQAGNISELELTTQQAASQQAAIDLARVEGEVAAAREALGEALGLTGARENWDVARGLPDLPREDPPRERLEELALAQRLDLAAARRGTRVQERNLELTRASTFKEVNVGVFNEQDPDGFRVTGPSLSVSLPLFDRQQGRKEELAARIRQSRSSAGALELAIRREVRIAHQRLVLARQLARSLSEKLIPLQARASALTLQQYNYMLAGVYQLLTARQNEATAHRDEVKARADYWIAWTSLERAVGRRLIPSAALPRPDAGGSR